MKASSSSSACELVGSSKGSIPAQGSGSERFGELVGLANEVHANLKDLENRIYQVVDGLLGACPSANTKDPVPACRAGFVGKIQDSLEHSMGSIKEINEVLDRL
ncbi:MAG: hypothetical protein M0R06_03775 [Sphaerochaeta sp.]|jgi:hypothetical protein|nr:hypothetical protein [Sphaerochaeta sp.]